jgi:hypothetical protein
MSAPLSLSIVCPTTDVVEPIGLRKSAGAQVDMPAPADVAGTRRRLAHT